MFASLIPTGDTALLIWASRFVPWFNTGPKGAYPSALALGLSLDAFVQSVLQGPGRTTAQTVRLAANRDRLVGLLRQAISSIEAQGPSGLTLLRDFLGRPPALLASIPALHVSHVGRATVAGVPIYFRVPDTIKYMSISVELQFARAYWDFNLNWQWARAATQPLADFEPGFWGVVGFPPSSAKEGHFYYVRGRMIVPYAPHRGVWGAPGSFDLVEIPKA